MDMQTSLVLSLFLTLFIANIVPMVRNIDNGKGWVIAVTFLGATASAYGFIRTLTEALGQ